MLNFSSDCLSKIKVNGVFRGPKLLNFELDFKKLVSVNFGGFDRKVVIISSSNDLSMENPKISVDKLWWLLAENHFCGGGKVLKNMSLK